MKEYPLNSVLGVTFIIGAIASLIAVPFTDEPAPDWLLYLIGTGVLGIGIYLLIKPVMQEEDDEEMIPRTYYDELPEDVQHAIYVLNADLNIIFNCFNNPDVFTDPEASLEYKLKDMHDILQTLMEDRPKHECNH